MAKTVYWFIQCTWGALQSLVGFVLFLLNVKAKHFLYMGSCVTVWKYRSSVSLGLFLFVTDSLYSEDALHSPLSKQTLFHKLLVHEYGHTIQSLILGPLYLIIIGSPSFLWASLPFLQVKRKREKISYYSFYTEKWANRLAERVTKDLAMR